MNWYYASAGAQKGPLEEPEFQQLVLNGTVTSETLVWREGMANWQPYREISAPAPVPGAAYVRCANCGGNFPAGEVISLAGQSYCASCKPIAVQRLKEGVVATPESEAIRQEHIKHEASIRSIGVLYYFGGIALLIAGIGQLVLMTKMPNPVSGAGMGVFFLVLSACQFVVGTGLRGLKPWARIPTGILSGLGLLGFPIGTLVNAYILYLVFSRKGKMVFSEEYQDVIAQTPHIKYRTSIVIWILLGVVVLAVAAALVVPFLARLARH